MHKIRQAAFLVARFGTRFLLVTKAMPKELMPIVDKPLIKYVAEVTITAGIDPLIFVAAHNKCAIENHCYGSQESEAALLAKGKFEQVDMVGNILPKVGSEPSCASQSNWAVAPLCHGLSASWATTRSPSLWPMTFSNRVALGL